MYDATDADTSNIAVPPVNQTMELNVSFYATVRDTVKEQLAGVVQNMFRDIEM